jgi:hypothetical protein
VIVYYIGGPADLLKHALPGHTPPDCLVYTMMDRDMLVSKHFYRRTAYLDVQRVWVYEYDPNVKEVQ